MDTRENLIIALTWAPIQRNSTLVEQFNYYLPELKRLKTCCSVFQVYPETTKNGSIHYHARLMIYDKIKWYKSVLPSLKRKGYVMIKSNPDEGWMEYMSKDVEMMSKILELEIPITEEHLILKAIRKTKNSIPIKHCVSIAEQCEELASDSSTYCSSADSSQSNNTI